MRVEEAEMNVRRLFITTGILVILGLLLLGAGWNTLGNLFILGGIIGLLNRYLLTPATAWFQKLTAANLGKTAMSACSTFRCGAPNLGCFFYGMIGLLFASLVLLGMFPTQGGVLPTKRATVCQCLHRHAYWNRHRRNQPGHQRTSRAWS